MKIFIDWQDQFGKWHQFTMKQNERDAFRTASARALSTKKRHRMRDENGMLLDLLEP